MTTRFVTAIVGSPFGLEGFVKVRSLSGEVEHFQRLQSVIVRYNGTEHEYFIEKCVLLGATVTLKFVGIDSPEQLKAISGGEILVDRDHAAPLGDGEWYINDLIDLKILNQDGTVYGTVYACMDGGGGTLLELSLTDGSKRFVPFRNEFIGTIDLEKKTAILLVPEVLV
ncbi:MAG: ribosome maturation factor RimM [Treponema sp.]|jgi:16S rRNA processing protein RimM|nr:ribosome maturation factor RimM [Treponema sp.]